MKPAVFITCEHASARVPSRYADYFEGAREVLATHRAYDPGALETAEGLAGVLGCAPPHSGAFTRLLVDLNRSLENPRAFSDFSPPAGSELRESLLSFYHAYRTTARESLNRLLEKHPRVIHVSVHSFTPVLAGKIRNAEFALLYDPARPRERELSHRIGGRFTGLAPDLKVRYNYPYRGTSDGHTRTLRRELGERYLGIELELNHRSFFEDKPTWKRLKQAVIEAIKESLG